MTRRTNGKTNDAGLTFFPVFRHSGISQKTSVNKKEFTPKELGSDFVAIS
jgi:hypothetical protein